jgi:hypothetical protein
MFFTFPIHITPVTGKNRLMEPPVMFDIFHLHKILNITTPSMYSFGFRSQRRLRKATIFSFLSGERKRYNNRVTLLIPSLTLPSLPIQTSPVTHRFEEPSALFLKKSSYR